MENHLMGILDRLLGARQAPAPAEFKNTGAMVGYFGVGSSNQRMMKYEDLASEGYLKNAIVYRCVNEIAKGASSVPFLLKNNNGDVIESHPLISLLYRPNPQQSYGEFFNAVFGYLMLGGNTYILRVQGTMNLPRELHLLRPDRIEIKGGSGVFPEKYEYRVNGRVQNVYEVDQETGFSDLKQVKLWHPLDDFYGCSPLTAAAMEVDQHNSATRHNINLLENGARPSGAVVFKPKDDQGYAVQLSESQRQQLLTDLNQRFTGTKNAGRPMLLEGDFDWKEMGLSPRDMDFINLKHMSATDIAMCFGVPSQLVGVPDAQTYANVAEARLALYEETIIPYLRKVESDLNEWLVPQFGDDIYFEYDVDEIPALSERRRRIYENVLGAVDKGIMTRNEAREMLGLSPIDGADDLLVAANLFPLGSAETPDAEDPEDEEDLAAYEEDSKAEDITNFPTKGENKKISLRNSNFPQFDYGFAKTMADDESVNGRKIWKAGGNIRGNDAYRWWSDARDGSESPAVLAWIKEREAWCARHTPVDGNQFAGAGGDEPNLSNIAGVVALIKWGAVNPKLGIQGMKDVILEVTKKLEDRKSDDAVETYDEPEIEPLISDFHTKAEESGDVSDKIKATLKDKMDEHNDKVGGNASKRATLRMLIASFRRGVGAYRTNPESVRPNVTGPDQWAFARVNSLLFALRTGRFQGGKHDTDLLPKGHPLSSKK
jgi:HK97 family phage portal protein